MSKEDMIIGLETMGSSTSGLVRTELEIINAAIAYIDENDQLEFAKRILSMIDKNGASSDEIKQFCENYIQSKEEQDG